MKPILLALLTILPLIVFSQLLTDQQFNDFGAPSEEEIKMRTCSFDPEASVVVLRKDAVVQPDRFKMFSYYRYRIKILKKSGLDYGNIRIRFMHDNGYEQISNIKAVSINYDENGTKKISSVDAKNIYPKKEDEYYSTITFSMPEVREGTIIEYSYLSERSYYKVVDYWYFQDILPVLNSVYDYTIMPNADFSYRVLKSSALPIKMKEFKLEGRLVFEMNKLPGVNDEPFMDSKRDYLSRVELQMNSFGSGIDRKRYVSSWPELTQELLSDENFGNTISGRIKGTEELLKQAETIPSPRERMLFLYDRVQRHISWNQYLGIYTKEKLKTVWETRSGSSGEINLTLINLLNESKIKAYPLLVSDRSHGKINTSHPFVNQFSKVIAFVQLDDRSYFLDATEINTNPALIPETFLNTTGYLVDRKKSGFVEIKDALHISAKTINITGQISNGQVNGQAYINDRDYSRINIENEISRDRNSYIRNKLIKPYQDLNIDSFKVANLDNDTLPLNQQFNFSQKLEESGDYFLLYTNLFSGMEKNPFLANNRYTEINFGTQRSLTFNHMFDLMPDTKLESSPKNILLRTPDTGMIVSRLVETSADGKKILLRTKVEIKRTLYSPEEYNAVKEFYKKLYEILNEPIVIRRKS
ncbi:MAG TPA: DUF3857 domain-containing protein [Chitinophagaceae bacterium]|nr:DUF3857 domain-containing protein [Chitinophagaceae bacterium]